MDELEKIWEYLLENDKTEWALIIQGLICEFGESDIDYSEDEGDALDEGIPTVNIDPSGFHSLV
tara:strand:- start:390 stop:581 length:192 start_codon:yes stop_codon:yes gene_type:complete